MSKYRNKPMEYDGHRFASIAEANRYRELQLLERAGEIENIELQPRFKLYVNGRLICTYVGDFEYWDKAKGRSVLEDVKGVETPAFKLKSKLFEALFRREITLVRAK